MTAGLVPVESGTPVKVCSLNDETGTVQCEQRADTVVRHYDPRTGMTAVGYRCPHHRTSRRIGLEILALLEQFPGSRIEIEAVP